MKSTSLSMALARICVGALMMTHGLAQAIEWKAEASLQNLQFALIDLDPSDGVVPALTFNQGLWLDVSHRNTADQVVAWQQGTGLPGTAAQINATALGMSTWAEVTQGAPYGADAWARFQGTGAGTAVAQAYLLYSSFSLTPHTQLVTTADATTQASGRDDLHFTGAGAQITFHGSTGKLAGDQVYTQVSPYGDLTDPNRALWVSLTNASTQPLAGELYAGTWAASVNLSPVPEPGTRALWLTALACMACANWRRARAATH